MSGFVAFDGNHSAQGALCVLRNRDVWLGQTVGHPARRSSEIVCYRLVEGFDQFAMRIQKHFVKRTPGVCITQNTILHTQKMSRFGLNLIGLSVQHHLGGHCFARLTCRGCVGTIFTLW